MPKPIRISNQFHIPSPILARDHLSRTYASFGAPVPAMVENMASGPR
jgi:hypothetical protein